MSAGVPTIILPARFQPARTAAAPAVTGRPWIRLAAFAALTLYGLGRWATLLRPAPGWRLVGVLALALAIAGGVPLLRRRHGAVGAAAAVALMLAAFPVCGLSWHWVRHVRIAVSAERIGTGLQGLPGAFVPYAGHSDAVRLVIVLGAAVLALDGAAVLAFAPRALGDARRVAAALPLIALAIVPSTLVRPALPYLQGLLLFGLLALFLWGERVRRGSLAAAVAIAALAGVAGAIAAPRLDPRTPWIDYRAWTATPTRAHLDTFDWNQSYGPLHWPHSGHVVLTVAARTPEYWKAEDLDVFNGYDWVQAARSPARTVTPELPPPSRFARARWTEDIRVTISGMQTGDVIAAGYAPQPAAQLIGFAAGAEPGTWTADRPLGPGSSYEISTYAPHPTAAQLIAAGRRPYPTAALAEDLTLSIPQPEEAPSNFPTITFARFHSAQPPSLFAGPPNLGAQSVVTQSPYGAVDALARRLAAASPTPYAYVQSVLRLLSHYSYTENPPVRQYPLASFLFTDREGYCQQFSGAMAMLLRMGGVPARVAAGFTSGTYDSSTRQWVVTDIDAHAWVEVWFPRYGWVRFDPTPVSAPARSGQTAIPIVKNLGGATSGAAGAPRRELRADAAPGPATDHRAQAGLSPWLTVAGVALLIAAAGALRVLVATSDSAEALLAELERALSRTRRPLPGGVTLADLERRFDASPEASGYIRALRLARYGGHGVRPSAAQRRALRQELRRGLGSSGAIRALWALPPRIRWRKAS